MRYVAVEHVQGPAVPHAPDCGLRPECWNKHGAPPAHMHKALPPCESGREARYVPREGGRLGHAAVELRGEGAPHA
eukprot:2017329-Prymnesium_polylepis.1